MQEVKGGQMRICSVQSVPYRLQTVYSARCFGVVNLGEKRVCHYLILNAQNLHTFKL